MEEGCMLEIPVLLLDSFNEESQMLYQSLKDAGFQGKMITLSDDGFLPDDVISIYTYYCGQKEGGKPAYFNQIDVPDYWEIKASNTQGQVFDLNHERAKIFFTNPLHKRLVRVVDWYDDTHVVRCSEHYNKYGFIYAKTLFNKLGQLVSRSYYDKDGVEKVVENFVTHDILLNEDGKVYMFKDKVQFTLHLLKKLDIHPSRLFYNSLSYPFFVSEQLEAKEHDDVLFWQEGYREDIPGNMQVILNGQSKRTSHIYVQKKESFEKLVSLGANTNVLKPLGFLYSFKKENQHTNQILICTNSDRIEKLTELVLALPNMKFHICALTEMSQKLMNFDRYDNVHLYPGAKVSEIDKLFDLCDYYLDINYENEIVDATKQAFLHNMLILSFNQTVHNRKYVLPEFIMDANQYLKMVEIIQDESHLDLNLNRQRAHAMSQSKEDYKNI